MRTIALEEHFVTRSFIQETGAYQDEASRQTTERLLDLGSGRIRAMDEAGIDLQVLSLAAIGLDQLPRENATGVIRDTNDELAAAVRDHPDRLAGFATLALKDPGAAAKELQRSVTELGFKGAMLDGMSGGGFLDGDRFLPVFEAADGLGVPVYLHPAPPPETVKEAYFSGLPEGTARMLSMAGWGWHAENGLHALRLIVSGLFDRLPRLQVVVGHMGEGIPYALARSSHVLGTVTKDLQRGIAEYFRENFHVTTSGYFTQPPFRCAMEVVGIDRMMYSVDYPFSPNGRGREFLDGLQLSEVEMEKLTHGNAERLLRV